MPCSRSICSCVRTPPRNALELRGLGRLCKDCSMSLVVLGAGDPARKEVIVPEPKEGVSVMDAESSVTGGCLHLAQTFLCKLKNCVVDLLHTTSTTQNQAIPDSDHTTWNFQVSYTRCFHDNCIINICIQFPLHYKYHPHKDEMYCRRF